MVYLFNLLASFLVCLRELGYEILWMGDFNSCTEWEAGWDGAHVLFTTADPLTGSRYSSCEGSLDRESRTLLQICSSAEIRILNGLA